LYSIVVVFSKVQCEGSSSIEQQWQKSLFSPFAMQTFLNLLDPTITNKEKELFFIPNWSPFVIVPPSFLIPWTVFQQVFGLDSCDGYEERVGSSSYRLQWL